MTDNCLAELVLALTVLIVTPALGQDASEQYDEPYQRQALEMLRTSIAYRTSTPRDLVPSYANYLAGLFRDAGFPEDDIHLLPLQNDGNENTTSLVVRYRGHGVTDAMPILFLAHMDVVVALESDWERDPFTLTEEGDYFYGRGVADNKAGVVALTSAFLRLKSEGFQPSRDLIIAFTGDEETWMGTVMNLATEHLDLINAEFALNSDAGGGSLDDDGEAFAYWLQGAEKLYADFDLTIRNPGGHSSAPRADNAIYELAHALVNIEQHRFETPMDELMQEYYRRASSVYGGELGAAMRRFADDPNDLAARDIVDTDPSVSAASRTTCVATLLEAGHAENALPQTAKAVVNCRVIPGVSIAVIQEQLIAIIDNDDVEIVTESDDGPNPASPLREDVLAAVSGAIGKIRPGLVVIPYTSNGATDGRYTRIAGIPTYGVSPMFAKSNDSFSHGLNERIPVRSFYDSLEYWPTLMKNLAK